MKKQWSAKLDLAFLGPRMLRLVRLPAFRAIAAPSSVAFPISLPIPRVQVGHHAGTIEPEQLCNPGRNYAFRVEVAGYIAASPDVIREPQLTPNFGKHHAVVLVC